MKQSSGSKGERRARSSEEVAEESRNVGGLWIPPRAPSASHGLYASLQDVYVQRMCVREACGGIAARCAGPALTALIWGVSTLFCPAWPG